MDTETGEMQEMTTPTAEDKEKMKQYFMDKRKFMIEEKALFKDRWENAKSGNYPTFKAYSAFGWVMFDELGDLFELLENIYENLVEMDKDITSKAERLEKVIQELSSQTGAELDNLKTTLKEPMWNRIDQFLQTMKEEAEKRKKKDDPSRQMII